MSAYEISVVIPTKDRQRDLLACMSSIERQSSLPHEVIIVNDGEITDAAVNEMKQCTTTVTITESNEPPGLSTAKNSGAEVASGDVVLFLDDDVVLGENYISRLTELYESYDDVKLAGIGGFDPDEFTRDGALKSMLYNIYEKVFRQGSPGWSINAVGQQSGELELDSPAIADWLPGYNSSYLREVLLENPFVHRNGGREALEDVELGWRLSQAADHFVIDPGLKITHNEGKENEGVESMGVKAGRNRVHMFRRHGNPKRYPLFLWAGTGEIMKHIFYPTVRYNRRYHWKLARGLTRGYVAELWRNQLL